MTFGEVITALLILSFFFVGFSQVFLPANAAWHNAMFDFKTAKTIHFISESFKNECIKPDRNIDNWKKAVSATRELEDCVITEIKQDEILRALKAVCIISGERIEIIGLCTP
jgi:hypothetical protein